MLHCPICGDGLLDPPDTPHLLRCKPCRKDFARGAPEGGSLIDGFGGLLRNPLYLAAYSATLIVVGFMLGLRGELPAPPVPPPAVVVRRSPAAPPALPPAAPVQEVAKLIPSGSPLLLQEMLARIPVVTTADRPQDAVLATMITALDQRLAAAAYGGANELLPKDWVSTYEWRRVGNDRAQSREQDLTSIQKQVLLVDGSIEIPFASDCVIVARGAVHISHAERCIVVAGAGIDVAHDGSNGHEQEPGKPGFVRWGSVLVTRGPLEVSHAHDSFVATKGRVDISHATRVTFLEPIARQSSFETSCRTVPLARILDLGSPPKNPLAGRLEPLRIGWSDDPRQRRLWCWPVGGKGELEGRLGTPLDGGNADLGSWRVTFIMNHFAVMSDGVSDAVFVPVSNPQYMDR